jgi:hypothetical protein
MAGREMREVDAPGGATVAQRWLARLALVAAAAAVLVTPVVAGLRQSLALVLVGLVGLALRPFLIMNPRSGGGKVGRFRLKDKAEALGATVALLEGPGTVDVGELARQAVAEGADLLGVAAARGQGRERDHRRAAGGPGL